MLKQLEDFGKYMEITGFKEVNIENAKIFLDHVCRRLPEGVEIQFFNADLIATWQHIYFAALNALVAFRTGRNQSKSLAVETALYTSAQRQIKKALDLIGVKPATSNAAVLVIGDSENDVKAALRVVAESLKAKIDETVLELSEPKIRSIQASFNIQCIELETGLARKGVDQVQALVDLVVERGALLSTRL